MKEWLHPRWTEARGRTWTRSAHWRFSLPSLVLPLNRLVSLHPLSVLEEAHIVLCLVTSGLGKHQYFKVLLHLVEEILSMLGRHRIHALEEILIIHQLAEVAIETGHSRRRCRLCGARYWHRLRVHVISTIRIWPDNLNGKKKWASWVLPCPPTPDSDTNLAPLPTLVVRTSPAVVTATQTDDKTGCSMSLRGGGTSGGSTPMRVLVLLSSLLWTVAPSA